MITSSVFGLVLIAGSVVVGPGCSVLKPKHDLTQFYVLRAQSLAAVPDTPSEPLALRVGPGRVADYLNSTPIVVNEGSNRIRRLDLHHWAEPLDRGVNRVLIEDLTQLLPSATVTTSSEVAGHDRACQLRYTVTRLEGELDQDVFLDVSWSLREPGSNRTLTEATSQFTVPASGLNQGVEGYVMRLSSTLAQWSRSVAEAIAKEWD